MSDSARDFPSAAEGLAWHALLCGAVPDAVADVCRAYLEPLQHDLAGRYAGVDPHLVQDAVHQALLTYVQQPHAYQPARGELAAYLRMAARSDLLNLLKSAKRHAAHFPVADEPAARYPSREAEPPEQLERAEQEQTYHAWLAEISAGFSAEERCVLELILAGERRTEVFATALGLAALPAAEQAAFVKRVKDRLKRRLQRGRQPT